MVASRACVGALVDIGQFIEIKLRIGSIFPPSPLMPEKKKCVNGFAVRTKKGSMATLLALLNRRCILNKCIRKED